MGKELKKGVLNNLIFNAVENGRVHHLNWESQREVPKTSEAYSLLKNAGLHDKKVVLFLPFDDMITYASFINIPKVKILFFDQANAFDLAHTDHWVVLKKDLDQFKKMVSQWI